MKIWVAIISRQARHENEFPRIVKLCEWTAEGIERALDTYARRHWSELVGEPVPAKPPESYKETVETYFDHSPYDDLELMEDLELPCFSPEFHADEWLEYGERVGPLDDEEVAWPMYSYGRPAYQFWDAVANGMRARGWTPEQIRTWLQSKLARWALDGDWGDHLRTLGFKLGSEHAELVEE